MHPPIPKKTARPIELARWRMMRPGTELDEINRISDNIQVNFPEDAAIFIERFTLFPQGAFTLECCGEIVGYCVSHPWTRGKPPKLNSLIGAIPADAASLFVHDIGIIEEFRGHGFPRDIIAILENLSRYLSLPIVSGVAVNGTQRFWQRLGYKVYPSPDIQHYVQSSYTGQAVLMSKTIATTFERKPETLSTIR